jgi:hypothetical protein
MVETQTLVCNKQFKEAYRPNRSGRPGPYRTCPVSAVVSTGRRNTQLEPPGIEDKGQSRSLGLDQQERCRG